MATRAEAAKATDRRVETALVKLLTAKPYGAITIADIAREANVCERTVQRHYRTKNDLLALSVGYPAGLVAQEYSKRSPAQSPGEAVRDMVEGLFAIYDRHSTEAWTAHRLVTEVPELRGALRAGIETRASHIDTLIKRWPKAWAVDKELARRTMLALTSFLTWRALTEYSGFSAPEAAKFITGLLCRSLLLRRGESGAGESP